MPVASDLRQEPGAEKPHAGICAGGGSYLPSLVRCAVFGGRSYPPDGEESGEPASSLWRTTRAVDPAPLFHAPLFRYPGTRCGADPVYKVDQCGAVAVRTRREEPERE